VQSIRSVHATAAPVINLGGPAAADRILSDSYSEDRPQLAIRELADAPKGLHGVHRAVGCQLIYNRRSGQSLFLGALSSDRLLTIFHLKERSLARRRERRCRTMRKRPARPRFSRANRSRNRRPPNR
jgi:alpha-galactosidase